MAAMKSDSHSQQERSSVMMAEKHFMETCSSGGAIPHPVANNNNINNADNHSSNSTNSHPTTSEIHQATQHPEEMTHNHTLLNATMHGGEQRVNETHIDYHELNNTTNTHREGRENVS